MQNAPLPTNMGTKIVIYNSKALYHSATWCKHAVKHKICISIISLKLRNKLFCDPFVSVNMWYMTFPTSPHNFVTLNILKRNIRNNKSFQIPDTIQKCSPQRFDVVNWFKTWFTHLVVIFHISLISCSSDSKLACLLTAMLTECLDFVLILPSLRSSEVSSWQFVEDTLSTWKWVWDLSSHFK